MGQTVSNTVRAVSSFVVTPAGRRRHPHALHAASKAGDSNVVTTLINDGAALELCNEVGCTPLHFGAREGQLDVVRLLLEAGARADPCNTVGSTPLHWAADGGHEAVVRALVAAGANVDAATQVRNTALHLAAKKGHAGVVQALLELGADLYAVNQDRRLALHLAARYGHMEALEGLLEADCGTVSQQDKNGRTPLHLAALGGHQDAVNLLLDMDADIGARDRQGATPMELGSQSGLSLFASSMTVAVGDSLGADMDPSKPTATARRRPNTAVGVAAAATRPPSAAPKPPPRTAEGRPLTGAAAELMDRLDPRLRYLVTPEALNSLNDEVADRDAMEAEGEEYGSDDGSEGQPMVQTLSGLSIQFDWDQVQWERPVDSLVRQSLRASTAGRASLLLSNQIRTAASSVLPPLSPPSAPPMPAHLHIPETPTLAGSVAAAATPDSPHPQSPLKCRYRTMLYGDLLKATDGFASANVLGEGGFGAVYKGTLATGMPVAVKVLDESGLQGNAQFRCEVKVLSRMRHPHVVKLLGSCPSRGCLVYEYLSNGSLEDRLECKDGTPPLTWQSRISIAFEMATGLLYLHNSSPEPIVHRDFKPANVLLDDHFSVKLGDVGLARLAPELADSLAKSHVQDSVPVGTFQYIDPEYMRTGQLSPKSDVYSLGITLLQLLTGLPPAKVVEVVEQALDNSCLDSVVDRKAGDWPADVAEALARLGLTAAEMKRRSRPDLEVEMLPTLRILRRIVLKEQLESILERCATLDLSSVPIHFRCPISQEVMSDPVMASDGFVYERSSLERWLEESDVSPMTNSKMEDSHMEDAGMLRSAIEQWRLSCMARSAAA